MKDNVPPHSFSTMLTQPPFTHEELISIKAIKAWFTFDTIYTRPTLESESHIFAHIIRQNSSIPHHIEYRHIDCSYFMWLCIFHFNTEAAIALRFSIPNVERYLREKYNIHITSNYPLAIHFALLSQNTNLWDRSMYKYFELVSMDNLNPGTIVSWAFESFLHPKTSQFKLEVDTGHTGCVCAIHNNEISFCHSVPKKDDPKPVKQGGPTESIYTLDGYILKSISRGVRIGGGLKLKG